MSRGVGRNDEALREAAQWFARLNARSVSAASLYEFRAWRRKPGNDAAYGVVEKLWREGGGLEHDPDIQDVVAEALKSSGASVRRIAPTGRWLLGGFAVALLAVALLLSGVRAVALKQTYATAIGEEHLITLEDGSRVRLDTDTRLAVRFTPAERRIELLKGQAFFDVAHNANRPFIVDAGTTRVRAVGTRFDVRRDQSEVQVALVQGVVKVASFPPAGPPREWTLAPGDKLTASPTAQSVQRGDVDDDTSWMSGRLVFRNIPLAAAIEEVNRYTHGKIILNATALADVRVNGTFESGHPADFVSAVSALYDLHATPKPDGSVVLSPGARPSQAAS